MGRVSVKNFIQDRRKQVDVSSTALNQVGVTTLKGPASLSEGGWIVWELCVRAILGITVQTSEHRPRSAGPGWNPKLGSVLPSALGTLQGNRVAVVLHQALLL